MMETKKLNIAFVWHMHQPLYKDPFTSEYLMPWVLLHATKDYYDMAAVLDEFPEIHQTFNVVPCLIDQLNDYAEARAKDRFIELTRKDAATLTQEDKIFLLKNFFQANWDNMIRPFPRYWELLAKRGISNAVDDLGPVLRYFGVQDYLDLQLFFNLAWIDPSIRERDEFLSFLIKKGRGFSEEDKARLIDIQTGIAGKVIPKYKEMQERGIIEVSTTPYYHPIMPLLHDSQSAKVAMPDAVLPRARFNHPEDVAAQMTKAAVLYEKTFGRPMRGVWPSEGSVSQEILPAIKAAGARWLASDEGILSNSLKRPVRRDGNGNCFDAFLYKPYAVKFGGQSIDMIFRDRAISDLIGFDYAKTGAEDAANDLVGRLMHVYNLFEDPERHVVPIILDGENAWENFANDGRDFFKALYSRLSDHPKLRCTTVSEFLDKTTQREDINWLYPGSWIDHNFKIWIGHHEDNAAWDYISEARSVLVGFERAAGGASAGKKAAIEAAWEEVYAAEGSDWFWWYGDEHSSLSDEHFDTLFRRHIKRIYHLIGKEPPLGLDIPIITEDKGFRPEQRPGAYINPVIDGEVSNYFEWLAAGRLQHISFGTAMHKEQHSTGLIESILYGFSRAELFFRLDYQEAKKGKGIDWRFTINVIHPSHVKVEVSIKGGVSGAKVLRRSAGGDWVLSSDGTRVAASSVVELAIGFDCLGLKGGDEMRFFIDIDAGEHSLERWPAKGFIVIDAPTEDFESENWLV